ncbi:MAG: DUF6456 domain-containing protein [Sphingomicrobium sp.]
MANAFGSTTNALRFRRVTMSWDSAPLARSRGAWPAGKASMLQIAAKRRFGAAFAAVGSGSSDILWRVACAGKEMREAEGTLGWPALSGKLVLTLALDGIADYYRIAPGAIASLLRMSRHDPLRFQPFAVRP